MSKIRIRKTAALFSTALALVLARPDPAPAAANARAVEISATVFRALLMSS